MLPSSPFQAAFVVTPLTHTPFVPAVLVVYLMYGPVQVVPSCVQASSARVQNSQSVRTRFVKAAVESCAHVDLDAGTCRG